MKRLCSPLSAFKSIELGCFMLSDGTQRRSLSLLERRLQIIHSYRALINNFLLITVPRYIMLIPLF